MNLLILSNAVNFIGLALSVWLGIFCVTRSPQRVLTRSAALALWAIAGHQLGNLMYFNQLSENTNLYWAALVRWSTFFAPTLWLHFSLCWLPLEVARTRQRVVLVAYIVSAVWTAFETIGGTLFISDWNTDSPLTGATHTPSALFPLFILYALVCISLVAFNLLQARRLSAAGSSLRRHLDQTLTASALAALGVIYLTSVIQLQLAVPNVFGELALMCGVGVMGYAVAQESARLDGRHVQRDFLYALLSISFVCAAYLSATLLSYLIYGIPFVTFILVLLLAVVTHSAYDWARTTFDWLFFAQPTRELRANLRTLAQEAGNEEELTQTLNILLTTLCQNLEASRGALCLPHGDKFVMEVSYRMTTPPPVIMAEELQTSSGSLGLARQLQATVLHVLHVMEQPVGVLVLGPKESGGPYGLDDEDLIAEVADRMEKLLALISLRAERTHQLNAQVAAYREAERAAQTAIVQEVEAAQVETTKESELSVAGFTEKDFVSAVEDALRHLNDITQLSEHRLASLQLIVQRLPPTAMTNLDRGKALKETLVEAMNKLRPADKVEPKQPSSEWYPFLILRDAYMVGVPNKEIMARYYISEGTFNRTRRRTIRAVAKVVAEMELNN
jgi:hypothetical protein